MVSGCVDLVMFVVLCVFFFQAEDGIRDLVRSRGLGDVYKRQTARWEGRIAHRRLRRSRSSRARQDVREEEDGISAVSYTHLTLPTSDLV